MATVRMPSSLQAQITRRAISPRFAIRIFLNILELAGIRRSEPCPQAKRPESNQLAGTESSQDTPVRLTRNRRALPFAPQPSRVKDLDDEGGPRSSHRQKTGLPVRTNQEPPLTLLVIRSAIFCH